MAGRDNKKSTTEEFIRKAKGVHGDKYDYSKVDYVRAHAKVEIGCKVHGAFLQAATSHLDGKGCPYCRNDYIAESKRMTTEQFVERAMKTHGDKGYDYSRVDYVNAHTPITIVCPVHGEFKQRPNKHLLSPTGCKKCKHAKWGLLQRKGTERFIEEARLIHGDRYDYSVTQYSGIDSRLSITCKIHGSFEQFASSHLAGHGCARCGFIDTAKARTKTQQEFIDECKSAHLDKYDYSKTAYSGIFNTITVVCKEHGDFTVIAASHRGGTGCPECSSRKSKLERDVESILDGLGVDYDQEKTFPSLVHRKRLRFDFYIPSLGLFIEAQGQQHVKPIDYFGGEDGFVDRLAKDEMKRIFAANMPDHDLLEVWFDDCDIESTIKNKIKEIKKKMRGSTVQPNLFTV